MDYETKETAEKEKFATGAQRNDPTGKGQYVLVSPIALRRIAGVYERGACAHGRRNWEQGLPISRCLDSAIRHIYQYIEGFRDEDHLAQAAWNLCAAIHMEEMVGRGLLSKELNDMPNYLPQECANKVCSKCVPQVDHESKMKYVGAGVTIDDCGCGIIKQWTVTTDGGIMVDVVRNSDGKRLNLYFDTETELQESLV